STNGTLDLNNFNNTISPSLTLGGGSISTGTGTLTLSPNTTITTTNASVYPSNIGGNVNIGGGTLTIQGNGNLGIFANLSGSANIVLNDSVDTYWFGSNSFAGSVTCNGTTFTDLGHSLALGNTNNTMTVNEQAYIDIDIHINITNQSL